MSKNKMVFGAIEIILVIVITLLFVSAVNVFGGV